MKTTKQICQRIMLSTIILTVAALTGLPGSVRADDTMKPMKPAEHMMMLNNPVTTTEQADALTPDDSIAMVCAKCKTVYVTRVKQGTKGAQLLMRPAPTELIGSHACAGCGGTWTITGVGKGAKGELKHTCSMCGDNSGFCCATTANSKPTEGMEDKK